MASGNPAFSIPGVHKHPMQPEDQHSEERRKAEISDTRRDMALRRARNERGRFKPKGRFVPVTEIQAPSNQDYVPSDQAKIAADALVALSGMCQHIMSPMLLKVPTVPTSSSMEFKASEAQVKRIRT